jgi:putative spermidine/putrescine transport system permease protein
MPGGDMTGGQRWMRVFVVLILAVMIAPIIVVILLSFSSASYLTFPPPALGIRWYREYLGSRDWLAATWLSVEVAVSVVVLSTVLGTAAALGLARLPAMARTLATGLILSPLIMPVIIVAIGLYYAFARYGLVGTPAGLVLAHTCLAVPFVVTSVGASLAGFDRRLEMAALSLGATPFGTFRQVTLPLILPGVLVGALFAFITSFDELVVSLFLSGANAVTLPRRMWEDLRYALDPTIAAVSTLTILVTVVPLLWMHVARRRET